MGAGVTIHPVCVVLPGEVCRAAALWRVVELGALVTRTPLDAAKPARNGNGRHTNGSLSGLTGSADRRGSARSLGHHLDGLLALIADKLASRQGAAFSLWIERRELAELLLVMDEGLALLSRQSTDSAEVIALREAISEFLFAIRQQLPAPRKPTRSQSAPPAARALAAAGAD
jgi:hypothetical protein